MSEVILHDYWRSSASYRVRIALNLAGIHYRSIPVDLLAGQHRSPDYLQLNPQGLVPTLEIDNRQLTQSLAIVEYLSEEKPESGLMPADSIDRQRVRAIAYAIAMDIHPICNMHVADHVEKLVERATARQEWMRHFISDGLGKVETMLAENAGVYCYGQSPTIADICLIPQVYNARRWGVDLTKLERILAIEANCADIPAFRDAHPERVKPQSGEPRT